LVHNVIGKIRDWLPDAVICSRVNVFDGVPSAATQRQERRTVPVPIARPIEFRCREQDPLSADLTEPKLLLAMLRDLGVPMVNITMGNPYAVMHVTRPLNTRHGWL